jgi:large subunit ribosomal protein L31e
MAKETDSAEKIYKIPLTRGWLKAPTKTRANRAVNDIKRYLEKHTKAEQVKVSQKVNELVWRKGIKNPPSSVRVKVIIKDGIATARLPDEKIIEKKVEKPKGRLEGLKEKAQAVQQGKPISQVASNAPATTKQETVTVKQEAPADATQEKPAPVKQENPVIDEKPKESVPSTTEEKEKPKNEGANSKA